jgi:hypothetical protein
MTALITTRITSRDYRRIVRDQIAAILATESVGQQALAVADSEDPDRYKLKIYTAKSDPIAAWIDAPDNESVDATPIVNIWFERQPFPKGKGNTFSRQQGPATFHIDCYGYGKAAATVGGHTPGDTKAEDQADWALTVVRKILMAAHYNWLGMVGYVASRWPAEVQFFQPQRDGRWVQHAAAYRLTLEVEFNEFAPQVEGNPCEGITTTIRRAADGEVLLIDRQDFS